MKEIERVCLAIYQNFSARCSLKWTDEKLLGLLYQEAVIKIKKLKRSTTDRGVACCQKTLEKLWKVYFSTVTQA
ncbi:hypothetical protein [Lactococcus petauri]|uniref:hypothetical protein n=1 Tax=Lactococcus petauri TaxID=1940789 RepID=UPI003854BB00